MEKKKKKKRKKKKKKKKMSTFVVMRTPISEKVDRFGLFEQRSIFVKSCSKYWTTNPGVCLSLVVLP